MLGKVIITAKTTRLAPCSSLPLVQEIIHNETSVLLLLLVRINLEHFPGGVEWLLDFIPRLAAIQLQFLPQAAV